MFMYIIQYNIIINLDSPIMYLWLTIEIFVISVFTCNSISKFFTNKFLLFNSGNQGGTSSDSPKGDDTSNADSDTKDSQKLPFCEIQWRKVPEFGKTRKIKTPDERPTIVKEKVRWSYSPDEGPKCTTETFIYKKKEKKAAHSPVQVWKKLNFKEVLI